MEGVGDLSKSTRLSALFKNIVKTEGVPVKRNFSLQANFPILGFV